MAILSIGELLGIGPDQLSGFVPYTAVEGSGGLISGINGSGLSGLGGGGADPSAVSAIASAYAESAASGKLDNSASGLWYPMTGNPSGFLVPGDITGLATTAYVDSSVSAKVDQSAFDNCCSSMSAHVSSIQQDTANISAAVSGITGGGGGGPVYHDATMTGSGLSSVPLGIKQMRLDFDSAFTKTVVGNTATIGINQSYSMPVLIVSTPGEATASNIIYVVTGTP